MLGDGEHHLGHAVAARLGAKRRDERPVQQAADHGREDDEPDPEAGHVRVRDVPGGAVVAMAGEQLGDADDQLAERDRAEPGADADDQREGHQPALCPRGGRAGSSRSGVGQAGEQGAQPALEARVGVELGQLAHAACEDREGVGRE